MSTKKIKLVVEYDGTDFCGWAAQPEIRTVQGTLKDAIQQVTGESIEVMGASRTDGGAHAVGQVCHFDSLNPMPVERWVPVINRCLPHDISVRKSTIVPDDFHSRYSAKDRTYRYRVRVQDRKAIQSRFAHDVEYALNLLNILKGATILEGQNDFFAFSEQLPESVNATRTISKFKVTQHGSELWFDVTADAFMRGMMRRMAGVLIEVGLNKRPVEDIIQLLNPATRSRLKFPVVLPAKGLCLMKIRYGRHPKDFRKRTKQNDFPGEGD